MTPRQPRVLVVDDDEKILSAFADFLKQERCRMFVARGTQEAMRKIGRHHVDLLITDIRLKYQSGVNLLLHMKAVGQDVPVIVITGFPDYVTENDIMAYGADYFFLKPLDLDKLREAVRRCLKLGKQ